MTAYATPADLRARYAQDEQRDEFAQHTDAHLAAALHAASAEIDSWRPSGELSTAARAVLAVKCLTLARMIVHQDHDLDATHPIVRDGLAVRDWLKAVAARRVALPSDVTTPATEVGLPAVSGPARVFGADLLGRY